MNPKVSICIPTYNGEKYLAACLDSVAAQTFTDFEVLVVDDCSADATLQIAREYAFRDSRYRILSNVANLGLVGNWNRCVELAKGEWIKFVFQDDLLHTNCVALMLQHASRPVVFCKRQFLFEDDTNAEAIQGYESLPDIAALTNDATDIDPVRVQDAVLKDARNFFGEPTASLLNKSVFDQFGPFNENLAQFCDQEYWVRVTINTGLAYVPKTLASFRYHSTSTSAANRDPLTVEQVNVFDELILLHEYAYDRHFAPLRRRAAQAVPARRFRRDLARKASWVKARANALATKADAPDIRWLLQWNRVVQRYPRIGWSVWQLPYRAQHWLTKRVGWRRG